MCVHAIEQVCNTTSVIQFRDSAINIGSPADGDLDINADDEIELNSTLIDINGNVEISGTTAQVGVSTSTAKDIFNAGMSVKNGATSAGFVEFFEDSDNGTNKLTLIGPASSGDITVTLPIREVVIEQRNLSFSPVLLSGFGDARFCLLPYLF